MSSVTLRPAPTAWLLGSLSVLLLSFPARGDQPGVARTRDVSTSSVTPASHAEYAPHCPPGGFVDYGHGPACPQGYCPGYHDPCCCHYWGRWWGTGCRACSHKVHNILSWLHPHGLGTVSPDHGWAPPGKVPMRTVYVPYRNLYPEEWQGLPSSNSGITAPTVYMPTDTTQLGYYYQHAPAWRPYPGNVPGPAVPSQWHRPLCGPGGCPGGCPQGMIYFGGEVLQDGEPTLAPRSNGSEHEQAPPPSPVPSEAGRRFDVLGPTATFSTPRSMN